MKDQQGPPPSNAFLSVLQAHEGGEVLNELTDGMRECVQAVGLSGKPATMTFSVKFIPAAKGAFGVMCSKPKVKKADGERYSSLWFGDDSGNLHRENPKQGQLPLKTVADPQSAPIKDITECARPVKSANA